MKNILALVHDDNGQEARLQAALDVTRAVDGHLSCLDVVTLPRTYPDALVGTGMALLLNDERTREDANCDILRDRLNCEDVAWDLRQVTDDLVPAIKNAAEEADLIILNSRIGGYSPYDPQQVAGDVAIDCQRPILAVPDERRGIEFNGTALIAWNGSHESGESLRAALPLLKVAEEVVLLEIERSSQEYPATQVARYLSRHEIRCRIESRAGEGSVADMILRAAREVDAAYIVMGAYGHSRTREALFGGVTRSMLETSDLPLLIAH